MIIMLYVKESSQYKKDFERAIRQGKKLELLEKVLILLIYRIEGDTLFLARLGSHSELFK